jgi:hypothetical protein
MDIGERSLGSLPIPARQDDGINRLQMPKTSAWNSQIPCENRRMIPDEFGI